MSLFLIFISTALTNNYLLTQFLGLCPFMGVSKKPEAAIGMGLATTFVLTLSAMISYLLNQYVLIPLDITYLKTIAFIVIIAATVSITELVLYRNHPVLYQMLGIFLPLITTNCAVLGVALINSTQATSLLESTVYGFGAAIGFTLVLALFAGIRERLEAADIPAPFAGNAIIFITAGIMSIAFMGLAGIA